MIKKPSTRRKRAKRSFTDEFKKDAVNLVVVEGYSFARAADAVGVNPYSEAH
jgi:transposase